METTFHLENIINPIVKNNFYQNLRLMQSVTYKNNQYYICEINIDWINKKRKVNCLSFPELYNA